MDTARSRGKLRRRGFVSVRTICALLVEFHVQRLGYIRPWACSLYRYVFDAGPNKHDILLGLLLSRKSQQGLPMRLEDEGT